MSLGEVLGVLLTCDPRFVEELKSELGEKLSGNISMKELSGGVLLLDRLEGNEHAFNTLTSDPPLFLRHLFPVLSIVTLAEYDEPTLIAQACHEMIPPPAQLGVLSAVQCRILGEARSYRAVDVKRVVDGLLTYKGYIPEVKQPDYIVSVVVVNSKAYCGWSTPQANLSRWSGGAVHYGQASNSFSRARHKLEEAVEVLQVSLKDVRRALDLGAAPGGWTSYLLSQGTWVTAVDTGDIDAHLLKEPRLTFLKQNVFDLKLTPNSFDLITCDMSWDPLRTAEMLIRLSPLLKMNGSLVMTVKFMGYKPIPLIREVIKKLARNFALVRGRHLWHNREELTLYFTKTREGKASGTSAGHSKEPRGIHPAGRRRHHGRNGHSRKSADQSPVHTS